MSQYELSSQNLSIMEGGKIIEERCGSLKEAPGSSPTRPGRHLYHNSHLIFVTASLSQLNLKLKCDKERIEKGTLWSQHLSDLHLRYSYKTGVVVLACVFYKWTWQAELSGVKEATAASSFPPASLVTASRVPSRHGVTN